MKRKQLVSAIVLGLMTASSLDDAFAQDQTTQKEEKLQTVVVTGSLIPQAEIETASPVITISAQQIEKQGFGTVYDALRATPVATGAVQDNQATRFGGFTPGAGTISLLGLDPSFTLYLINGHPLADYPLQYNGQSNIVDLSNVPVGMVDHIDILPGNQSSIYGSSAIAGVVNIILKDHIDGYELNVRAGGYSDGGGANQRIEFLGGKQWGDFTFNYGLQLTNQQPIWAYDRTVTKSTDANPNPALRYGIRNFLYYYLDDKGGTHYVDPGQETCDGLSNLVHGSIEREFRPGLGYYCGSKQEASFTTILNQTRSGAGYANFKYKLNDSAELYGNMVYSVSSLLFSSGPTFWNTSASGLFINADTGRYELFQHWFDVEEMGNVENYSDRQVNRSYNAWGGLRGTAGNNWDYDIYYARSQTNLTEKSPWPLTDKLTSFFENQFLGPKLGSFYGYPIYSPNVSNFYKAITPAQFQSFIGTIESKNVAWTQNLNVQIANTDLFSLPAGSAGIAALVQAGNQAWSNPIDPALLANEYYERTGTSGSGTRNNYAGAIELRLPLLSVLTADASARYDNYGNQNIGGGDSKATYKLGLEYRPLESLLFRGNYATAFRAPDMAYTFGGKSGFFVGDQTDYYRCALAGGPLNSCDYFASQEFTGVHEGNAELKSVTAKSYGFGFVWSPTADFSAQADYYNVAVTNEVDLQSIDTLLRQDSDCLLGNLDPNSPTCKAAIAQVQRTGPNAPVPNAITGVTVFPINIASERVGGVLTELKYRYDFGRWGSLSAVGQYNVTLKHTARQSPGDPEIDALHNPYYSSEFKTIATLSLSWDIDKFDVTVLGTRYGKTPNYWAGINATGYATPCATADGYTVCPGRMPAQMIYNGSLSYNITDDLRISAIINNIANSGPPKDYTYTDAPYYNAGNYNPYGRAYSVEIDWRFGRAAK